MWRHDLLYLLYTAEEIKWNALAVILPDSCDDDERGRPRGSSCWLCNNIACPAFKVSRWYFSWRVIATARHNSFCVFFNHQRVVFISPDINVSGRKLLGDWLLNWMSSSNTYYEKPRRYCVAHKIASQLSTKVKQARVDDGDESPE